MEFLTDGQTRRQKQQFEDISFVLGICHYF